jgi:hypothetical protein
MCCSLMLKSHMIHTCFEFSLSKSDEQWIWSVFQLNGRLRCDMANSFTTRRALSTGEPGMSVVLYRITTRSSLCSGGKARFPLLSHGLSIGFNKLSRNAFCLPEDGRHGRYVQTGIGVGGAMIGMATISARFAGSRPESPLADRNSYLCSY